MQQLAAFAKFIAAHGGKGDAPFPARAFCVARLMDGAVKGGVVEHIEESRVQ